MSTVSSADDPDLRLWLRWKQAAEVVRAAVVADVAAASSVPEPELAVLVHLDHAGGTLRQNALAAATGWDRTRLSHLLTRMEQRGLLTRTRLRNGVELATTPAGAEVIAAAARPLREAVQRHLSSRLDAGQRRALLEIATALIE